MIVIISVVKFISDISCPNLMYCSNSETYKFSPKITLHCHITPRAIILSFAWEKKKLIEYNLISSRLSVKHPNIQRCESIDPFSRHYHRKHSPEEHRKVDHDDMHNLEILEIPIHLMVLKTTIKLQFN